MARLPSQDKTIAVGAPEPWIYIEERRLRPELERAFLAFIKGMKRSFNLEELEKAMRTGRLLRVLRVIGIDDATARKLQREMLKGIKIAGKRTAEETEEA